ncbi:MAG: glycosyltransferase [Betaproteobacteria bacterium]|nr:glycosyltransferase [Betaproteobacteria bacterium]
MNRNDPCPCGSGKRYKHCHGSVEPAAPRALHLEALAAHRSGSLAKFLAPQADARQEALVAGYLAGTRARQGSPVIAARVSVVLPVRNGASGVARAIASVAAQTYADIELVVVDDGSTDGTPAEVDRCLSALEFPAKLVRREQQGVARAANEGALQAQGRYLAFLDADDWYAPERIECMVAEIARAQPLWGFSQVGHENDTGDHGSSPPGVSSSLERDFMGTEPASFTLLDHDVMRSSGNLFVERELFLELGGYRDDARDGAQHRGWEFGMRASDVVEPVPVARQLYFLDGKRRDPDAASVAAEVAEQGAAERLAQALTGDAAVRNEFSPRYVGNRELLLRAELRTGRGDRVPVPMLRSVAAAWRGRALAPTASGHSAATPERVGKTALVVLGFYRSGTSALSRVLNLCGAVLPERVVAARLGINPKGFWESEAVRHLDARLLLHLGGDWKRVDFDIPHEGPLVDEFLADSRELLASEYGDAPLILIKDPRICILAPLWHRTLQESGYRPVYVVPVRNPLEAARSLDAQGDLPVADGMALWLAYMQRIETFVDAGDVDAVHVRYTELLDDWRSVVERIARHLGVPLATEPRAEEVDRFLEAGLRNQRATDADLEPNLGGAAGEALGAQYRRLLERCERDAAYTDAGGRPRV